MTEERRHEYANLLPKFGALEEALGNLRHEISELKVEVTTARKELREVQLDIAKRKGFQAAIIALWAFVMAGVASLWAYLKGNS